MWVSDGGGRGVQWWAALRSPARLAQLLQRSLAFCFSLQPMTAYRPRLDGTPVPPKTGRYAVAVIGCKLKQNANEGCNSCATGV